MPSINGLFHGGKNSKNRKNRKNKTQKIKNIVMKGG